MNGKHLPGERDVRSTLLIHLPPCSELDLDKQNMDELSRLNLCWNKAITWLIFLAYVYIRRPNNYIFIIKPITHS